MQERILAELFFQQLHAAVDAAKKQWQKKFAPIEAQQCEYILYVYNY